jgi:hypothetical protein
LVLITWKPSDRARKRLDALKLAYEYRKHNGRGGAFPFVSIALCPLQGGRSGQVHALVVIAIDTNQVTVLAPLVGEPQRPRNDFQAIWAAMRFLTLVIAASAGFMTTP